MSGLLCSSMVHPMGAKGILLKSRCLYMYAYAEIVGAMFVGCIMFNMIFAWGNKWSHKCIGNLLSTPAMIA